MKDMKRAYRRFQKKRLYKKTKDIMDYINIWRDDPHKYIKKRIDNLQICSCYMCANRRKYDGPPISELKKDHLYYKDE